MVIVALLTSMTIVFVFEGLLVWFIFEILLVVVLFSMTVNRCSSGFVILFFLFELFSSLFLLLCFMGNLWMLGGMVVLMKFGIFPFWFWVVRLFEEKSQSLSFLVMWAYKTPLIILVMSSFLSFELFFPFLFINFLSSLGLFFFLFSETKQFSFFVIFSSGWLLFSLYWGEMVGLWFFLLYGLMLFLLLKGRLSSMMGLIIVWFYLSIPPLPSFFLKLTILLSLVSTSFFAGLVLFSSVVVLISFIWMRFSFTFESSFWSMGGWLISLIFWFSFLMFFFNF